MLGAARSPERERLASAISRYERAEAALTRIRDAQRRVYYEHIFPANRALDTANVALAEAGKDEPRWQARAFLGEPIGADPEQLRKDVSDAEAKLEQARQIRIGLDEREREAQRELDFSKSLRESALAEVVSTSPELATLIDKFRAAQREAMAMKTALDAMTLYLPTNFKPSTLPAYDEIDSTLARTLEVSIDTLRTDPDAALPSIG